MWGDLSHRRGLDTCLRTDLEKVLGPPLGFEEASGLVRFASRVESPILAAFADSQPILIAMDGPDAVVEGLPPFEVWSQSAGSRPLGAWPSQGLALTRTGGISRIFMFAPLPVEAWPTSPIGRWLSPRRAFGRCGSSIEAEGWILPSGDQVPFAKP